MNRQEREYHAVCAAEGFDLLGIEQRGKHLALHFDAGVVFAAKTPSDRRNRANVVAQVRRIHRTLL